MTSKRHLSSIQIAAGLGVYAFHIAAIILILGYGGRAIKSRSQPPISFLLYTGLLFVLFFPYRLWVWNTSWRSFQQKLHS